MGEHDGGIVDDSTEGARSKILWLDRRSSSGRLCLWLKHTQS